MDRLVWPTLKAHLCLSEAAHVKNAVGRSRIRRNKQALRELICLQEILCDVYAGEFGRTSRLHDAAETARRQWIALQCFAAKEGAPIEDLCEIPTRLKAFLFGLLPTGSGHVLPSEATISTRVPSTTVDCEIQSNADSRSDTTALQDGIALCLPGGQRARAAQLDGLATILQEQLDQEHTLLLSSIEEVQGLMEAELTSLPTCADLEAFNEAAEFVLAGRNLSSGEAVDFESGRSVASTFDNEAQLNFAGCSSNMELEFGRKEPLRWADLVDSDDESTHPTQGCQKGIADCPKRALSQCCVCGKYLDRSGFSRRAWRKARRSLRGPDANSEEQPAKAACFGCAMTNTQASRCAKSQDRSACGKRKI